MSSIELNNEDMIGDYFAYSVMGDVSEIFKKANDLRYENLGQFHLTLKAQIFFLSKK